ncbi:ABC-2 type transporter-domain-containing protein [Powellomyces hirtus]|nr:ABC-2 type transporter-domain-containing protein [Powellomyces hirtus]
MSSSEMKQVGSETEHETIDIDQTMIDRLEPTAASPQKPVRGESLFAKDTVSINMPQSDQELRRRTTAGSQKSHEQSKRDYEDMEIYWEDIRYSVMTGSGKNKKELPILKGDAGRAQPGQLVAIMGGSGAGKTTLLNVLAGRVPTGDPTGIILANGKVRDRRKWKRIVGYVEQEDLLYENLTVRETLETAALLRLPSKLYSRKEKLAKVDQVMEQLGISHVADSKIGSSATGGISGGQKKRVSIGIELVTDPGTMFLDEPTTELDAATANNICDMLKKLARKNGKTIIMTIHMPRETILDMIDKVALMSKGQMVWFGPAKEALAHFERLGHKCPPQTNPADFFLDLIQVDTRDENSQTTAEKLIEEWEKVEEEYIKPIDNDLRETANEQQDALTSKQGRAEVADNWSGDEGKWATSWFSEFSVLLKRNFQQQWRNIPIIIAAFAQQIILCLLIGFVFFRITRDQAGVQNRQGVLFFICINQTFSFLMPIITVFPLERRIIVRERASGSYRTSAAYLAKAVSQFPLACITSFVFAAPVYWLIGLNPSFIRWLLFQIITQCLVFAAQGLGMLIGSSVPNVQMAQVFGPLIVVMFIIFGGNFANQDSIPAVLRWIQWLSLIRYTYGAYMQNEFNGLELDCGSSSGESSGASAGRGCTPLGDDVVKAFGLNSPSVGLCILILLALGLAFHVLAALILRKTTRMRMRVI